MSETRAAYLQETKQHGSVLFPFNIYPCTIPRDFPSVALHWHKSMELVYVKKGRGQVQAGMRWMDAEAGDIFILPPGTLHALRGVPGSAMEYENIIFEMNFLSSRLPEKMYSEYFAPMLKGKLDFPVLISPDCCRKYADAAHFLDMADDCCRDRAPAYEIAVKGYLFCFFSAIFSDCRPAKAPKVNENVEKLKSVLMYVEEHYADVITIDEMAALCGFSSSHFMRFFKQTMGKPFTAYLNEYRLSLSAKALTDTHDPVLDIAQSCGFDNLSYFNRQFKKRYGITPSAYRRTTVS